MSKFVTTNPNQSNQKRIWTFLTSPEGLGLTEAQAAGVMGNMEAESGYSPGAVGGGHGLIQWTSGRKDSLYNFAKKSGKKWDDLDVQLNYMKSELMGSEKTSLSKLRKATTVVGAADVFNREYERSGEGVSAGSRRGSSALAAYKKFSGSAGTVSTTNDPVTSPIANTDKPKDPKKRKKKTPAASSSTAPKTPAANSQKPADKVDPKKIRDAQFGTTWQETTRKTAIITAIKASDMSKDLVEHGKPGDSDYYITVTIDGKPSTDPAALDKFIANFQAAHPTEYANALQQHNVMATAVAASQKLMMDIDGNGTVSPEEQKAFDDIAKNGYLNKNEARRIIARGEGTTAQSRLEYQIALNKGGGIAVGQDNGLWKTLADTNNDGQLSGQEARIFNKVDTDADGKISLAEANKELKDKTGSVASDKLQDAIANRAKASYNADGTLKVPAVAAAPIPMPRVDPTAGANPATTPATNSLDNTQSGSTSTTTGASTTTSTTPLATGTGGGASTGTGSTTSTNTQTAGNGTAGGTTTTSGATATPPPPAPSTPAPEVFDPADYNRNKIVTDRERAFYAIDVNRDGRMDKHEARQELKDQAASNKSHAEKTQDNLANQYLEFANQKGGGTALTLHEINAQAAMAAQKPVAKR